VAKRQRCTCGLLEKLAQDPRVCVTYQADRDAYLLDASAEVNFCPFCGGYEKAEDRKGNVSFFRGAVLVAVVVASGTLRPRPTRLSATTRA